MTAIFIDAGPLIARYVERDQHHAEAVDAWKRIQSGRPICVTTSHVLAESFTVLGRRVSNAFAAERARHLLASQELRIERASAADEIAAVPWFERLGDQRVSFTDAVSFAVMKRLAIRRAFTFDRHFEAAGFERFPR
jgi:predicted nucleic acid-binding protein